MRSGRELVNVCMREYLFKMQRKVQNSIVKTCQGTEIKPYLMWKKRKSPTLKIDLWCSRKFGAVLFRNYKIVPRLKLSSAVCPALPLKKGFESFHLVAFQQLHCLPGSLQVVHSCLQYIKIQPKRHRFVVPRLVNKNKNYRGIFCNNY